MIIDRDNNIVAYLEEEVVISIGNIFFIVIVR